MVFLADNRTPSRETLSQRSDFVDGGKGDIDLGLNIGRRIGKRLQFEEDKSKKMAPSTPCVRSLSIGVIDICDSDDEKEEQPCVDRKSNGDAKDDDIENLNDCDDGEVVLSVLTPKRKRASKVVVSDSENEENDSDDDDVPICKLKRIRKMISGGLNSELSTLPGDDDDDISNVATPRRRLVSLRELEGQKRMEKDSSKDNVNDESKDDSSSNSDSKDEFIVESSDESNYEDSSEDESEDSEDFGEIISQLNRSNRGKSSWEFEADMLAALGKDPELCMRAVCALYRRQTSDEQMSKETFVNNLRGFSKFDAKRYNKLKSIAYSCYLCIVLLSYNIKLSVLAYRGSDLAQFLTNGGFDLNKSVEDLKAYDPSGVEKCRTLAIRYSRQLFEIYKNKEDPHFLPG